MRLDRSTLNRVQIILGAVDIVKKHWLIGIGYTNFEPYFADNYLESTLRTDLENYEEQGYTVSMHNWLMEILSEQGVVGLAAFMWFFYLLFKKIIAARKATQNPTFRAILFGHLLMLLAFLVQGFFYHTFISQFPFWMYAAFAMSTVVAADNEFRT